MTRGHSPWADAARLIGGEIRTIFDVGANVGQTTTELRPAFPEATIYSFEPVPASFARLEANTAGLERVRAFPFGFSDRRGSAELFLQLDSAWNSVSKNVDRGLGTTTVRLETIDAFCAEHGIAHIHLLKIDTEGHEVAVLRGAQQLLGRGGVDAVYCEVGFDRDDAGHGNFCELLEFLKPLGLQFFGLYGIEGIRFVDHPVEPCYPWSNALFVRNALVQAAHGDEYARWWASIQPAR